jgi:hypothetical protein
LGRLDPATPPLAAAVRSFAEDFGGHRAMNTLARVSNDDPAHAARLRDGEATSARIADLCTEGVSPPGPQSSGKYQVFT